MEEFCKSLLSSIKKSGVPVYIITEKSTKSERFGNLALNIDTRIALKKFFKKFKKFINETERDIIYLTKINDVKIYQIISPKQMVKITENSTVVETDITFNDDSIKNKNILDLMVEYVDNGNIKHQVYLDKHLSI
jgi:hypothetical protein